MNSTKRLYTDTRLQRLRFIRWARELGFSYRDIRLLIDLDQRREMKYQEANALTLRHLEAARAKIRDLKKVEQTLASF